MSQQMESDDLEDKGMNPDFAAYVQVIDNSKRMVALKYRLNNTDTIRQDLMRDVLLTVIESYLTLEKKALARLVAYDKISMENEAILNQQRHVDHIDDKAMEALQIANAQQEYLLKHMVLVTKLLGEKNE